MASAERALVGRADEVWALTDQDAARLSAFNPRGEVRALTVPSRVEPLAPGPAEYDVALLGTWSWQANARGLEWFSREVVPLLPTGTSVRVAGDGAGWLHGRHAGVTVLGRVADAREFLAKARVIAIPSTTGGGVQVKTLDAVATGLPVVATKAATRGLSGLPRSVKVAASAREFAETLGRSVAASEGEEADEQAVAWSRARGRKFDADVAAWATGVGSMARNG